MFSLYMSQARHRKLTLALFLIVLTFFVAFTVNYTSFSTTVRLQWVNLGHKVSGANRPPAHDLSIPHPSQESSIPPPSQSSKPLPAKEESHANATLLQLAPTYIKTILDPSDITFPRLDCPKPTHTRYEYLRNNDTQTSDSKPLPKYFFALDLHECIDVLPRLVGTLIETTKFLGPENCAMSIVEGRSKDGTYEVLLSASEEMDKLGIQYHFQSSTLNPMKTERISTLAKLRNLALDPLAKSPEKYHPDTTVVFINDIALCMEDLLELIHQRTYLQADMTCAMDWTYVGPDPTFYDVWIARTMTGNTFFEIGSDGNWNSAWNLFWDDSTTRERYQNHKPFQVFSCWNGATAFTAKPLLEQKIAFRSANKQECYQGEPRLWCKDMWHLGYGKIAVIPTVNVEYSDEATKKIKDLKGYVSHWVPQDGSIDTADRIEWKADPPAKVKCITDPNYSAQHFVPWDQGLS